MKTRPLQSQLLELFKTHGVANVCELMALVCKEQASQAATKPNKAYWAVAAEQLKTSSETILYFA